MQTSTSASDSSPKEVV